VITLLLYNGQDSADGVKWTRPDNHSLPLNVALDMTRSKPELLLENALLRQQMIILERQSKRPKLTWRDRTLIVLLASKLRTWKGAAHRPA
jgi:hypothetical protein